MFKTKHYAIAIIVAIITAFASSHAPVLQGQVPSTDVVRSESIPGSQESAKSLAVTLTYVREHHALPDYYITKSAAAQRGWKPSQGNLCDVLPGMMIGGDVFTNSEHLLPTKPGRTWYEADFDYACGNRNADRILYSNDGLIYTTTDHYRTVVPAP